MTAYDFIVVGAGSAGCVLANRLSADPHNRVLLIEAGPRDWNPVFRVPIMAGRLFLGRYCNWAFETEPEPHLKGRRIGWPRGRVLGGSSSINGMIYARGNRFDFDNWAQLGLRNWSYERVLPAFRRSERHHRGGDDYHGTDGPLPVGPATSEHPIYDAFIEAGRQAGYPVNPDFNGESQEGFGRYDYNIWHGQRWSAARSFLAPARGRPNLTVMTGAQLLRVTLDGLRASGVEVLHDGRTKRLAAGREVILSAGAVGSPMALLHSGIGEADTLRQHGIKVALDRRDVGRNLQDHAHVPVMHRCKTPDLIYDHLRIDKAALGFAQAALFGTGPFSRFPHEGGAFVKVDPSSAAPDTQIHFFCGGTGALRHPFTRKADARFGDGYVFYGSVCQLRPESVGALTLRSGDPLARPVIRANYLSAPKDRIMLREAVKTMRRIFAQAAFDPYRDAEFVPGPGVTSDDEIDDFVAGAASTVFHPVGTCRMGADSEAVVDEQLRVRGVDGLRIADASIMPRLVSANTHAACVMIGERAAEFILGSEAHAAAA